MEFFRKLERKYQRYAIPNLMYYITILYAVGLVIWLVNPILYFEYLSLDVGEILQGQVWRIVTFLLSLLWDFQKYYSDQNRNPSEDMLFAGRDYLLLTDEEFRQFTDEYERLCRKYMEKKSADAKPRNISIISSPVIEEGIPERHVKKNEKIL